MRGCGGYFGPSAYRACAESGGPVSNRRRLRPPATVAVTARAYRCGHCNSTTGKPRQDRNGVWRLDIHHDNTCPVLSGAVPLASAGIRAAAVAATTTGRRMLYVNTQEDPCA
jgi:hypothetical protein